VKEAYHWWEFCRQENNILIVRVTRLQLQQFTVSIKELAEWFGLEIARIVMDEGLLREVDAEIDISELIQ
jgi:hypothetical protein